MIDIRNVPVPDAIEELSYEALKEETLTYLEGMFSSEITFLESDEVVMVVEALLYREMLLRARINQAIRACFLPSAKGHDLDNKVLDYGIVRLEGESDEALAARALLSLEGFTTAGSEGMYKFHTMSVDSRIKEVEVFEGENGGEVDIIYYANPDDEALTQKIKDHLNKATVRPLTDIVHVAPCSHVEIHLALEMHILDLSKAGEIEAKCLEELSEIELRIGEDLPVSRVIKTAFVEGVFRVKTAMEDVEVGERARAHIASIDLTFVEAVL
jgi:phage-related baseplate assembly protein